MDDKKYVVAFKRPEDGREIRSKTPMSKSVAKAWIILMDRDHPQYKPHYVSEANAEEMAYLKAKLEREASGSS